MSNYLQQLIADYERDIMGNIYSLSFSNGEQISFEIRRANVHHLLGIGHLALRQVHGKYANEVYAMLKRGQITLDHITSVPQHKEVYKKIKSFHHIIALLHTGDAIKVVKRIGSLKSVYLLYLDHSPSEIVHLGIGKDASGRWYPESLLVLQRNVTSYIDGQLPLEITSFLVNGVPCADNTILSFLK